MLPRIDDNDNPRKYKFVINKTMVATTLKSVNSIEACQTIAKKKDAM